MGLFGLFMIRFRMVVRSRFQAFAARLLPGRTAQTSVVSSGVSSCSSRAVANEVLGLILGLWVPRIRIRLRAGAIKEARDKLAVPARQGRRRHQERSLPRPVRQHTAERR